jgi:peptidoglycan/LPS O-acetylase OafA/YrhL
MRDGSSERRLEALDGLRGLAILLVLAEHFVRLDPTTNLERLISRAAGAGWIGVDLFFVLSGFLITGILLRAKGGERYFSTFYLRRTLRIFPVYYGFLILTLFVMPRLHLLAPDDTAGLLRNQGWYWSYLSNVLTARVGWEGTPALGFHFWSLAVEEQFYLVWPLVLWLLPERRLKLLCAAAILGTLVLRLALRAAGEPGVVSYVLTPTHLDPLAAGAWLAALGREPAGLARLSRMVRPAFTFAVAGVGLIFLTEHGKVVNSLAMASVGYPLLALGCAAALVGAITSEAASVPGRFWRSRALGYLGRRSYAIYVLHPLLLFLVVQWGYDVPWFAARLGSQLVGQACFALAMVALSTAVAAVSWHVWEQPFLGLGGRTGGQAVGRSGGQAVGRPGGQMVARSEAEG